MPNPITLSVVLSAALAATSLAAVLTPLANHNAFSGPVRTATMDGLPSASFTYTEAGLTLMDVVRPLQRQNVVGSYNGDYALRQDYPSVLYSFPYPIFEAGWEEFSATPMIRLFGDAAGTQPLGDYAVALGDSAGYPTGYRFHGFRSDTPFQSMMLVGGLFTSNVNNLRYTPEPTALLGLCGMAALYAGRGVVGRRRS